MESEQTNVRNLLRIVGLFFMFPGWTIILAFVLIDFNEHVLHVLALLPFALVGTGLFVLAPRLAARWVPEP